MRLLGFLAWIPIFFALAAAAPPASDPLTAAKRFSQIETSAACDPAKSALCVAGRLSLINSAGGLLFSSSLCGASGCTGEAGDMVKAGTATLQVLNPEAKQHFPAATDGQFPARATADLAELDQPCKLDPAFCTAAKLSVLERIDQAVRAAPCDGVFESPCNQAKRQQMQWIDGVSSNWLAYIFDTQGWPDSRIYGGQADNDAWLLAQHADARPQLQQRALSLSRAASLQGGSDPTHVAYLEDRLAAGAGKPQIYGTQFTCIEGKGWEPLPMEDPANVDQRRAAMKLSPLAEYAAVIAKQPCG